MMYQQFSIVRLLTDDFRDEGVSAGAIGTILEIHGEKAYEVEFSRPDGSTIAWFAVPKKAVELVPDVEWRRPPRTGS